MDKNKKDSIILFILLGIAVAVTVSIYTVCLLNNLFLFRILNHAKYFLITAMLDFVSCLVAVSLYIAAIIHEIEDQKNGKKH